MIKINIRFILLINRLNAENKAPIICRLTYLKRRKQFSTGLYINSNYWKRKEQRVIEEFENSEYV